MSHLATPNSAGGTSAAVLLLALGLARPTDEYAKAPAPKAWIWIRPAQVRSLPMSGPEWDARGAPWFQSRGVYTYAQFDTSRPLLGNIDDATDVYVLAKALVWLRLVQEATPPEDPERYRAEVQEACLAVRGTENLGPNRSTLALGRNLLGFILAANLIDWDDSVAGRRESDFCSWVDRVRYQTLSDGGSVLRNLIQAHESRPNNWGLMCGASRLAAAIYLGEPAEEARCWNVFRRWLGDESSPFTFRLDDWGGLSWQGDRTNPVGINSWNAKKEDCIPILRSIGGVMPEEMRRAGIFPTLAPCDPSWVWPAYPDRSERNYNWTAMQGVIAQAAMHARRGRDPWTIGNLAIGRAFLWLYRKLQFPVTDPDAGDDDYWLPYLANRIYPKLALPEPVPTKPGQQIGFVDWTTLDPSWP